MSDKLRIDYSPLTEYGITPLNAVGPTTSTTLRTVTTYDDDNCRHVRKFGIAYEITQVTDIEDPVDVDMKFWVYALDGTLLGSRVGGGAFVAGTTLSTAQACYLKVTGTGDATMLTTVLIDTDVDAAGKDFVFPAEVIASGTDIDFYLSQTTSTYYDEELMYGGARHTPDGTEGLPYFKIQDALDACDSYFPIVTVLDSEIYDEELTIDGAWTLQAALGQTPTITCGIGARTTRTVIHDGNSVDTAYVSKTGSDDTGDGTWWNPYLTITFAFANLSGRTYVNIKDSETYIESFTATKIEPIYGQMPVITGTIVSGAAFSCSGLTVYKGLIAPSYDAFLINDNTVKNSSSSGIISNFQENATGSIKRNLCFNNPVDSGTYDGCGIVITVSAYDLTLEISNNICYNNKRGIFITGVHYGVIKNNICFNNSYGFTLDFTGTPTFENNTAIKNGYGFETENDITKCIAYGNTTQDIYSSTSMTASYTCYGTKNVNVTEGSGCTTTDPQFVDSNANNFALKVKSVAYKTDGSENDMGAVSGSILVSASTVSINGFIIDGQSQYFYGIYKTGSTDYSSLTIKWCEIKNFQGTGIDDYSGATTSGIFTNNLIHDSGNAGYLPRSTTDFNYNIIYNNIVYGLYRNLELNSFTHNVFFGNGLTGYYLPVTAIGGVVTNSIFSANGGYGINSLVPITVLNSCVNDYVSSLVEYLPESNANITDNPLFINENEGEEDFHLKSVARGYLFNSPCLEGANDGYDMGAYLETRSVNGGGWKTFQLDHEPSNLNIETTLKDGNVSTSNFGEMFLRGKNFKMIFPLAWSPNQATTEEQSKKIRYFQRLIPTIKNEKKRAECQFRLWFLPDTHLETGTATINGTLKTLTDTSKDWVEDDMSGFWIAVKHSTHASVAVTASTAQAVVTGAGWTTNEHQGRYFRINQIPYLILGNTTDTLQLSDPYSYLDDETVSGSIETYYRASGNDENEIEVLDPYSTLPSGSYTYYVAFVTCYISSQAYRYVQPNYAINKETWKSGYSITFEED